MELARYTRDRQGAVGTRHEAFIRRWLDGLGWRTFSVNLAAQYRGVDFVAVRGTRCWTCEVKGDERCGETGNAFIETQSSIAKGSPGWALTCSADWLLYYDVAGGRVVCVRPGEVRAALYGWAEQFSTRTCWNDSGDTEGLLVPWPTFASLGYVLAVAGPGAPWADTR